MTSQHDTLVLFFKDMKLEPAHPSVFPQQTPQQITQILAEGGKAQTAFETAVEAERAILWQQYCTTFDKLELITDVGQGRLPRYGNISNWFRFLIDRLPKAICPFNKNEFTKNNNAAELENKLWKVAKDTTFRNGCRVYFKSGEPLLVWLPCAIDEAYRGVEGHQPFEPRLRKWGETFEEKYPARILKKDKRYAGVYYTEQQKHYMDAGKAVGGGNYGIAPPIGVGRDQTQDMLGPWCHMVTGDSKGKGNAAEAAALVEFRANFLPVEEGMCAFSEAIDAERYTENKKHFDFITSQDPEFAEKKLADFQCHLCKSHVINRTVLPHKDVLNYGPVVETCWGDFVGGDFCLPEVGVKLPFQRGDFIYMEAAIVSHAVQHVTGDRVAWVQYNKSDATMLKQTVKLMEEGPEKEKIKAKKAALNAAKPATHQRAEVNELILIKGYRPDMIITRDDELVLDESFQSTTQEEYKMLFWTLKPRKLKAARSAKIIAIQILKDAGDLQGVGEAKNRPASVFKPLSNVEQRRWDKGLHPFRTQKEVAELERKRKADDRRRADRQEELDEGLWNQEYEYEEEIERDML